MAGILILEEYRVSDHVKVVVYEEGGFRRYRAVEPRLEPHEAELLARLKEAVRDMGSPAGAGSAEQLERLARRAAAEFRVKVAEEAWGRLLYYLTRDLLGYGALDPMMRDPLVEDIHVDGPGRVYVWHARWESLATDLVLSREEVELYAQRLSALAGRPASYAEPIVEATLPEGFRLELAAPPVSPRGPSFVVRKFFVSPLTVVDLVRLGTVTSEAVAYLWLMLDYGRNLVIVGPTGAGKTTLLNALLYLIRPDAKILTIEDVRELNIPHEHWQALVTRPGLQGLREISAFELVKLAMRTRPDYLVVGEVRGEEAYALFQAFSSGHTGATTIHAETVEDAIGRLLSKPMEVPPALTGVAHVFVRILRMRTRSGVSRRVVEVVENLGVAGGRPMLNPVFRYDTRKDALVRVGDSALLDQISRSRFVPLDHLRRELERRSLLISYMAQRGLTTPYVVSRTFVRYHADPEAALEAAREGKI